MAILKINAELSPSGIKSLQKKLLKLADRLDTIDEKFIDKALPKVQTLVKNKIRNKQYKTGYKGNDDLVDSIVTQRLSLNKGRIYSNVEYAKFVEFGTGPVGKGAVQHPWLAESSYSLDKSDGWIYKDDKTGEIHFTYGQRPMRFMYLSYVDFVKRGQYKKIYKEVLDEILAKGV